MGLSRNTLHFVRLLCLLQIGNAIITNTGIECHFSETYKGQRTKLASNAEWYTLCDFAPQNCLLVDGPQSPGTAPYRSWLRVSAKRFDADTRPAKNCIMEMCITGHSTDGKHHSQSMEKS